MKNRLLLLFLGMILLASCQDNMFLRSEKVLKNKIQKTWQRDFFGRPDFVVYNTDTIPYNEYWTFKDSKLYVTVELATPVSSIDLGAADSVTTDNVDTVYVSSYSIDAKLFNAFLKLTLLSGNPILFVEKWEIISLQNDLLDIAADDPSGNGVVQAEFFPRP